MSCTRALRRGAAGAVFALLVAGPLLPGAAEEPSGPAARMLRLVNAERAQRDLPALRWSAPLARLARAHTEDMRQAGKLSHNSTGTGADYPDRLVEADLPALKAAENIALGVDVDDAHDRLMRSRGHRANILSRELDAIGIGVAREGAAIWVCQDFAVLIPRLEQAEAARRLREALVASWQEAGGVRLGESDSMSAEARRALDLMVEHDQVAAGIINVSGPSWVFAYTTTDPAELPADVLAEAGRTRLFGAAVAFRRTGSSPLGLYWVAIALTDPVKP